jgi:hypothetical protein
MPHLLPASYTYFIPVQRVTAAAFAHEASGNTYSCAAATDNEVTLFTLDPYSGALSQRKVVTGV